MATEQTGNESLQEMVNENQPANTSMKTHGGFGGMVYEQYLKAKENAEAYPYVWSSYLIVYGGFGMWVAYRYRKLMKTEDRVRGLQERLRNIRKEREQGVELLVTSLPKIYDTLQTAYKGNILDQANIGQIVGVVFLKGSINNESEVTLTVDFGSQQCKRRLKETKGIPDPIRIAEVLLGRRILSWITGIILLIATLLGIHFLMTMSITRDTLLYSNVNLD